MRPSERDGGDGEEGGDADLGVAPVDFATPVSMEALDEDEGGAVAELGMAPAIGATKREGEDSGDDGGYAGAASRRLLRRRTRSRNW